ncbi:MAG TPA: hypothetical protein VMV66_02785 [Candidatus Humimicrobiaceae bacterium]|nr:hypothetical protein [Candidatus Humimicrobiaceae bacterium]
MRWLTLWIISLAGVIVARVTGLLPAWGLIFGIVWLGGVTFLLIWFWLARANRWFTFVKEGTAKIILKGGKFKEALIVWENRTFRYRTDKLEGDEKWEVVEGKEPLHLFGGLRLYSLLHPIDDVYIYRHRWTHLHEDGSIKTHDERLDYVYLKEDLYVIDMPLQEEGGGTNDINGMPMGIKIVLPMRIVNPYVASFRVRRWLPLVNGVIQARMQRFVANYRYKEDLLNMRAGEGIKEVQEKAGVPANDRDEGGKDLWEKFWRGVEEDFKSEGGKVETGGEERRVVRVYGVEVNEKGARILTITPGKKYQEYTTIEYETEQKRRQTVITADGERERIDKTYKVIQDYGDLGKLIRTLEALEKSPEKGAKWVIPLPGGADLFRGIFGERPPETVSPREFRELREMVEKIIKKKKEDK